MAAPEKPGYVSPLEQDTPELVLTIINFDQAQLNFFSACSTYASLPGRENALSLHTATGEMVSLFRDSIDSIIRSDAGADEQMAQVKFLIIDEQAKRTQTFRALTGDDKYETYPPEKKDGITEQLSAIFLASSSEDQFVENIMLGYTGYLQRQLIEFLESVPRTVDGKTINSRAVLKALGKNALFVAKVGLGVALGIKATRKLRD